MKRILVIIFALWASHATAEPDPDGLSSAMQSIRAGKWDAAQAIANKSEPIERDLIHWALLRAGQGQVGVATQLLDSYPNWPAMDAVQARSEARLDDLPPSDVANFFALRDPITATGVLALAPLLTDTKRLQKIVLRAWAEFPMSDAQQEEFLTRFPDMLSGQIDARVATALKRGWPKNAAALLDRTSDKKRPLFAARIALMTNDRMVNQIIAKVPAAQQSDPYLTHARFDWRMRKRLYPEALELILASSTSAKALGDPALWGDRRHFLAREALQAKDYKLAYQLASNHYLTEGGDFADLEWLSGFIALRYLNDPKTAATHFEHLRTGVASPISLSRSDYWTGRAYEAAGDMRQAAAAYLRGAQYQTAYYGLLSAEKAGAAPDPTLGGADSYLPWRSATFINDSDFHALVLLLAAGEGDLARLFALSLADRLDETGLRQLSSVLEDFAMPNLQVLLGKRAAERGIVLTGPYYPLHPMMVQRHRVPTELMLSIARRESEFNPAALSRVGARGLMQVMPDTARMMARDLGLPLSLDRMLTDWAYIARLGGEYLAQMSEQFNGNAVMIAAAYNAGPGRPTEWMQRFGDPRKGEVDIVDWVEMIPFGETRNYVMRVTESLPVYRARLGRDPHPVPFSKELMGSTLLPLAPKGE